MRHTIGGYHRACRGIIEICSGRNIGARVSDAGSQGADGGITALGTVGSAITAATIPITGITVGTLIKSAAADATVGTAGAADAVCATDDAAATAVTIGIACAGYTTVAVFIPVGGFAGRIFGTIPRGAGVVGGGRSGSVRTICVVASI